MIVSGTRLDPWQAEQPELIWNNSTLDSMMPSSPPLSSPSYGLPRSGLKVLSPKTVSNRAPHYKPMPLSKSNSHYRSDSKSLYISSHSKHSHLSSSHSSSKPLRSPSSKHSSKNRSNKYEFNTAASKVLAALNMSCINSRKQSLQSDFDYGVKIKKRKRLGLPVGDTRKNMVSSESLLKVKLFLIYFCFKKKYIYMLSTNVLTFLYGFFYFQVPKVVLRDIALVISKVCPKLATTISPTGSPDGKQVRTSVHILMPIFLFLGKILK